MSDSVPAGPAVRAHEWLRDSTDELKIYDDGYPYYVQCRLCGEKSRIITMGVGRLDLDSTANEPCPGVDMSVTIYASLVHPGQARQHSDQQSMSWTFAIQLQQPWPPPPVGELAALPNAPATPDEIVITSIEDIAKITGAYWQKVWNEYQHLWRQAIAEQQEGQPADAADQGVTGTD